MYAGMQVLLLSYCAPTEMIHSIIQAHCSKLPLSDEYTYPSLETSPHSAPSAAPLSSFSFWPPTKSTEDNTIHQMQQNATNGHKYPINAWKIYNIIVLFVSVHSCSILHMHTDLAPLTLGAWMCACGSKYTQGEALLTCPSVSYLPFLVGFIERLSNWKSDCFSLWNMNKTWEEGEEEEKEDAMLTTIAGCVCVCVWVFPLPWIGCYTCRHGTPVRWSPGCDWCNKTLLGSWGPRHNTILCARDRGS